MSIYDIRNQIELEQYTVRQAQVALAKLAEDYEPQEEDASVMLDIVRVLLKQAYQNMDNIILNMTAISVKN